MRFVINDDNGRLTNPEALKGVFERVDVNREIGGKNWIAPLSKVRGPFVLFLHASAIVALNGLRAVVKGRGWPDRMKGVVIFNSIPFAGLSNRAEANQKIEARYLSEKPIHILQDRIHNTPSKEVLDRVRTFVSVLRSGQSFAAALWHLDPPGGPDAVLAVWILNRLVHSDVMLAPGMSLSAHVLNDIEIDGLRAAADVLGLPFEAATKDSLRSLADILAARNANWPNLLLCPKCNVREGIYHALKRKSVSRQDRDTHFLKATSIYSDAPVDNAQRARVISRRLPLKTPELLETHIQAELDKVCSPGCHFRADESPRRKAIIEKIRLEAATAEIPPELIALLKCEAYDNIMDGGHPLSLR
jgi:hypothetical protein